MMLPGGLNNRLEQLSRQVDRLICKQKQTNNELRQIKLLAILALVVLILQFLRC